MTRLNAAVTTFGILVLLVGAREVPWGQMSEDEMFFGAFTWKNVE